MAVGAFGAVGAFAVGELTAFGAAGTGVAVADEPQASMAASSSAKGPRIIILGFFNQGFKMDLPSVVDLHSGASLPSTLA